MDCSVVYCSGGRFCRSATLLQAILKKAPVHHITVALLSKFVEPFNVEFSM